MRQPPKIAKVFNSKCSPQADKARLVPTEREFSEFCDSLSRGKSIFCHTLSKHSSNCCRASLQAMHYKIHKACEQEGNARKVKQLVERWPNGDNLLVAQSAWIDSVDIVHNIYNFVG